MRNTKWEGREACTYVQGAGIADQHSGSEILCNALDCGAIQWVRVHYSALKYSVLQCIRVHCRGEGEAGAAETFQRLWLVPAHSIRTAICCIVSYSVLHKTHGALHTAMHTYELHCTAIQFDLTHMQWTAFYIHCVAPNCTYHTALQIHVPASKDVV